MAHILEKTSGQPDDESGRVCKLWMSCSFLGTCELEAVCKLWRLWMWGKRYVPWITFLGSGPKGIHWHGLLSKLEFKAVRKFLALSGFGFALLKWRRVAKYWHLWIEAVCKLLLGIFELISVWRVLALVNWKSLQALVWLFWIGNSLQGIGTCELVTVCKVLALVNWQQFARYWQ